MFERGADPQPIGAGITLQPTGQAVLARLGLLGAIRAHGAPSIPDQPLDPAAAPPHGADDDGIERGIVRRPMPLEALTRLLA